MTGMHTRPEENKNPYTMGHLVAEVALSFGATFLASGLLAAFVEFFYVQSGDWNRVSRAAVTIAGVHSIIVGVLCAEVLRCYPKCHPSPLYRAMCLPSFLVRGFNFATAVAVVVVVPATILISFLYLFYEVIRGNEWTVVADSWRNILLWSTLISYCGGGILGTYKFFIEVRIELFGD